ncbi:hypothetical protein MVEN_01143700 [Mycena venus]|uniref:Uncharacterized protein n=1 Tax=Mycena venus TaxID=2733690 RepID=A0A8H6Y429_9AGAR|nr:hypothetical protein MVEN_01143700 [Mycena venus]
MKFAAVVIAFAAAAAAAAVPVARDSAPVLQLRDLAPEAEVRELDAAALNYLVSRGIFDEAELEERGLLSSLFGGSKTTPASGTTPATSGALKVSFTDPSGPVSAARQTQAIKVLKKAVSKADQAKFPFCSIDFGNGGSATFRCFSSAAKKIGTQGPAGALKI